MNNISIKDSAYMAHKELRLSVMKFDREISRTYLFKNKDIIALFLFVMLIISMLFSCSETEECNMKYVYVKKIIKAKNQAQETDYEYKYNVISGKWYQQPNIHSVYYIVYSDGSFDKVDVGKYSISNVGDTILTGHYQ